jgi:hypothetical protein
MARRALSEKKNVVYWGGNVPEGAPKQQLLEIYASPTRGDDPLITASQDNYPKFWEEVFK